MALLMDEAKLCPAWPAQNANGLVVPPATFNTVGETFKVTVGGGSTAGRGRQWDATARYMMPIVDLRQRDLILREAKKVLSARRREFDALAVRGMSGLFIGPTLATRLRVPIIAVRKSNTNSHSSMRVEAGIKKGRYVIVDDFVSTGETVERITETIQDALPQLTPVGLYLYRSGAVEIAACGLPLWNRPAQINYVNGRIVGYQEAA